MSGVEELRAALDQVDRDLQRLVGQRRELSLRVQSLRLRDGGGRHDLARERAVIDSYVRALGPEGAALAEALLLLCRGPVGSRGTPPG